jgi:hypothetical protein
MKKHGAGAGNWGMPGDEALEERLVRLSCIAVKRESIFEKASY